MLILLRVVCISGSADLLLLNGFLLLVGSLVGPIGWVWHVSVYNIYSSDLVNLIDIVANLKLSRYHFRRSWSCSVHRISYQYLVCVIKDNRIVDQSISLTPFFLLLSYKTGNLKSTLQSIWNMVYSSVSFSFTALSHLLLLDGTV